MSLSRSDRVPTTREVRERFVDGFPMDAWAVSRAECAADFDRWLAAHDAEVRDAALASREAPPAYLALDLWMALGMGSRGFDGYYDRNGWADTWANLLDAVRRQSGRKECPLVVDGEGCVLANGHVGPHMGASDVGSAEPLPLASREAETGWEYTWAGDDWLLDEVFTALEAAERFPDTVGGRLWVRRDGRIVRRRKAGPWEPVPAVEAKAVLKAIRAYRRRNAALMQPQPATVACLVNHGPGGCPGYPHPSSEGRES